MTQRPPRFHVRPEAVYGSRVRLDREESHHLRRVRRLRPGAVVELVDGADHHYQVRLEAVGPDGIEGIVLASSHSLAESHLSSTLVQGIPKGERMEWVIQKATELGVSRVIPLLAARSVVRLSSARASNKLQRWQRVAKEAAKQAGRGVIPAIERPVHLEELLRNFPPADLAVCLWEGATESLASVLDRAVGPVRTVVLAVGPEGGWDQAEVAMIEGRGMKTAGLGRRILRTESAALVGLAVLQFRFGDLGASLSTGFDYFDVAADIGVRARGATLAEAASALAHGVFNLLVPLTAVEPRESRQVTVEGSDEAALLVNWINELLYLHETQGWLLARAEIDLWAPPRLAARIIGERFEEGRHPRGTVVKAATYHDLSIVREPDGISVRMVLDV